MNIIDIKSGKSEPVFALVYGASGSGKTDFCGTTAELGRVLVIDIDKGNKTLKYSTRINGQKWQDNITVSTFDTFNDLDTMYKHIKANDPVMWSKLFKQEVIHKFDWIIIDSWTELQYFMQQELRAQNNLSGGDKLGFRGNFQIQHWGALTDLNVLAVESLRDCKSCNLILVCNEGTKEDPDTGKITYGVEIFGKLVAGFPKYFDDVIYTYVDMSGKYHATTRPKNKWVAKTRLGASQDLENPYAKQFFKDAPKFSD